MSRHVRHVLHALKYVHSFLHLRTFLHKKTTSKKQSILIFSWEASLAKIQFCMLPHIAQPERNSEIIRAKHFATAMFYFEGTILFSLFFRCKANLTVWKFSLINWPKGTKRNSELSCEMKLRKVLAGQHCNYRGAWIGCCDTRLAEVQFMTYLIVRLCLFYIQLCSPSSLSVVTIHFDVSRKSTKKCTLLINLFSLLCLLPFRWVENDHLHHFAFVTNC